MCVCVCVWGGGCWHLHEIRNSTHCHCNSFLKHFFRGMQNRHHRFLPVAVLLNRSLAFWPSGFNQTVKRNNRPTTVIWCTLICYVIHTNFPFQTENCNGNRIYPSNSRISARPSVPAKQQTHHVPKTNVYGATCINHVMFPVQCVELVCMQ